jgi:hypothetical protein
LYTDGFIEARDSAGHEFGYQRLNEAIVDAVAPDEPEPARVVRDHLFRALDAFADPDAAVDDTTLVVLSWRGSGVAAHTGSSQDMPFTLRHVFSDADTGAIAHAAPATTLIAPDSP